MVAPCDEGLETPETLRGEPPWGFAAGRLLPRGLLARIRHTLASRSRPPWGGVPAR